MAKYSRLKTVSSTRTVRYIFVAKNIIILWSCYIINPFQSVNTWYCSYIFKLMNIPKISTSYFSENLNLIHFVTVNTHVCCWRFELAGNITVNVVPKKTCLQYFLLILKHITRRSFLVTCDNKCAINHWLLTMFVRVNNVNNQRVMCT